MTNEASDTLGQVGLLWNWRRGDALSPLASSGAEWRTQATGALALRPGENRERAEAGAALLALPLLPPR